MESQGCPICLVPIGTDHQGIVVLDCSLRLRHCSGAADQKRRQSKNIVRTRVVLLVCYRYPPPAKKAGLKGRYVTFILLAWF